MFYLFRYLKSAGVSLFFLNCKLFLFYYLNILPKLDMLKVYIISLTIFSSLFFFQNKWYTLQRNGQIIISVIYK